MNTETSNNSQIETANTIAHYENIFKDLKAILEAPIVENSQEKLQYINTIEEFIFKKFLPLVDKLGVTTSQSYREALQSIHERFNKWVYVTQKPWLNEKFVIGIIGKFSSGKSSIINSVIGKVLLPVRKTTTTAIPTYLTFGEDINIRFTDFENNVKLLNSDVFDKFRKDYFERNDLNLSAMIKYFVVEYPNSLLQDITILDTPGYNAIDSADKQKTLSVIKESNLIIWVIDIQDGNIQRDALDFIEEHLNNMPLVIIVNKADQILVEEEREAVLDVIKTTFVKRGIAYNRCILFSNKNLELQNDFFTLIREIQEIDKIKFETFVFSLIDEIREILNESLVNLMEASNEIENKTEEIKDTYINFKEQFISSFNGLVNNWERTCDYIGKNKYGVFTISVDLNSTFESYFYAIEASINDSSKKFNELQEQNSLITEFGILYNELYKVKEKLEMTETILRETFELETEFKSIIK